MARTAAFSIPLGILFAWSWSRLEEPRTGLAPLLLMVALGVAPVVPADAEAASCRESAWRSCSRPRSRSTHGPIPWARSSAGPAAASSTSTT